jgi:hypothetical protein
MKDAAEFLDNLEEKARENFFYNIQKVKFTSDKEKI